MRKNISKKEKNILALHMRLCETQRDLVQACWQMTTDGFPQGIYL